MNSLKAEHFISREIMRTTVFNYIECDYTGGGGTVDDKSGWSDVGPAETDLPHLIRVRSVENG